jgi:hypothetical protein
MRGCHWSGGALRGGRVATPARARAGRVRASCFSASQPGRRPRRRRRDSPAGPSATRASRWRRARRCRRAPRPPRRAASAAPRVTQQSVGRPGESAGPGARSSARRRRRPRAGPRPAMPPRHFLCFAMLARRACAAAALALAQGGSASARGAGAAGPPAIVARSQRRPLRLARALHARRPRLASARALWVRGSRGAGAAGGAGERRAGRPTSGRRGAAFPAARGVWLYLRCPSAPFAVPRASPSIALPHAEARSGHGRAVLRAMGPGMRATGGSGL